jgi:hypothetical protein
MTHVRISVLSVQVLENNVSRSLWILYSWTFQEKTCRAFDFGFYLSRPAIVRTGPPYITVSGCSLLTKIQEWSCTDMQETRIKTLKVKGAT